MMLVNLSLVVLGMNGNLALLVQREEESLWRRRQSNSLPSLSAADKAGSAAGSVPQPAADLRQPAGNCRQLPATAADLT